MEKIIDFHVHPNTREFWETGGKYLQHAANYFGVKLRIQTPEEMAEEYRSANILGILLGWDAETNTGLPPLPNDYIAQMVKDFPDAFIGFASVDPWKGKKAIDEVERAARELGLKGVKFQQSAQGFCPNDRRFYPLWEKCAELKLPVLFHMGTTGLGAGGPGGDGIRLKYARPIYIDDVAADFPDLLIIGAHPAWPWQEEMLAIALHKPNVYIDLSGWSPKYFPESLVRYANSLLQDKCLFGTDFPFIHPKRWLDDFAGLPLKEEVRQKILFRNAKKLLGLAGYSIPASNNP